MKRVRPFTNDLVISMTLAEVFLLLLIVGWYGSRLESEAAGREPLTPAQVLAQEVDEATRERERQRAENRALQSRVRELEGVLDWLGQQVGNKEPIRDTRSAGRALEGLSAILKRGKAACRGENVLVHVVGDHDTTAVILRQAFAIERISFEAGQRLTRAADIEALLAGVQKYYSQRRAEKSACAFDFTLAWRTDRDFRIAKKAFEPYFYPAGDRQLQ